MRPRPKLFPFLQRTAAVRQPGKPVLIDGPALRNRSAWAGLSRWSAALGLVASLTASLTAHAGDILRGGAAMGARGGGSSRADGPNAAQTAQINANFRDALARTTQAVQSVQALQKSARAIATSGPNNLGMNPNSPGQRLPDVPNGLAIGGLQVAPAVPKDLANPMAGEDLTLWQGATLPSQTTNGGRTVVTIQQTSQQAVLNWQTFNVGKNTTVAFDQSKGGDKQTQWIAFNKILDPSGSPTQILGDIQANGQVYVINRNGIIFGGSSQVNTHGLVASSLQINDNLVAGGLLNNPSAQFLFSAATLNGNFVVPGNVTVQPGALLTSPTTPEHVGGRIALIGPTVTNSGTIETPDGQAIMAAGLQVGFVAHDSNDAELRGLDVFVGAETGQTGTVSNFGLIFAERASVIMTGKTVNQMAVIDSTTSVTLNGRIDLLANYNAVSNTAYDPVNRPGNGPFLPQAAGTVTLGAGSVTRILPEYSSTDTLASDALPLQSQMNLQGQNIHLASGSMLFAPNAAVSLLAGQWIFQGGSIPLTNFTISSSADRTIQPQIYLDAGALINVAGTPDVSVPISENILSVQLRGSELADSPLQRDGLLRGLTLEVDMRVHGPFDATLGDYDWVGTPLANAKGYRDLVDRSVGELTTAGGKVTISSGGSVVLQSGSTVDVSGGSISYQGGMVQTTRLLSQGRVIDISQATPDRVYDGVYTGTFTDSHDKYGISTTFTNPLALSGSHFEAGYLQGAAGGQITVTAPSMALDGKLLGNTQAGPRQESEGPTASSLTLNFRAQDSTVGSGGPFNFSPTPPAIVFQNGNDLAAAAPFTLDVLGNAAILSDERQKKVELSPELLTASGFGTLAIENSDGDISVPANVTLAARAGSGQGASSITLQAAKITIDGHVSAPGGTLAFTVYGATPYFSHLFPVADPNNPVAPVLRAGKGIFTLGEAASLSTAGLTIDQRVVSSDLQPLATGGGIGVSITSYSADLAPGSVIDVSGGVAISATGKKSFGNAGSINIKTGEDPLVPSLAGGTLVLGSELRGFSGAQGGSLSIQAPLVQIGGTIPVTRTAVVNGVTVPRLDFGGTLVDPKAFLYLTPDFFDEGGFTSFALTGLGLKTAAGNTYLPGVSIAANTVIAPQALTLQAETFGGPSGQVQLVPTLLPQAERAPVSLSFQALGVPVLLSTQANPFAVRGEFVMGAGARIETDPGASVTIKGDTATVLGSIFAPGGKISVTGGSDSTKLFVTNFDRALATVVLGSNTTLSTAGVPVIVVDSRGFRDGTVLNGGTISISGNIVAPRGATLDVSGSTGTLDLPPEDSGLAASTGVTTPVNSLTGSFLGHPLVPTQESSSGGTITLKGGQFLFSDATLKGAAGGPGALGGSLVVSSGVFADPSTPQTPLNPTLTVQQTGSSIPANFPTDGSAIGNPVINLPFLASSGGHISVADFAPGGFDVLNLRGTVQFKGPISISAGRELHVADGGVILADSTTRLTAPYVALGMVFQTPQTATQLQQNPGIFSIGGSPFFFAPTYGTGNLIVEASLIDVGNLSLQNIGQTSLIARNGDIRGDGFFNVAGQLSLISGQVYPATAVGFTITAFDYVVGAQTLPGTVNIQAAGTPGLPLSAGGSLSIYASVINQAGTLRAPIGQITLGWDGESSSAPPINLISNTAVATPVTKTVTLASGSITSVSAVDSKTGVASLIPYGLNLNGSQWIDPTGLDITAGGVPGKSINISGVNIVNQAGSLIDLSGGGDLFAYRFVPGVGGSTDILASTTSFAIIPSYQSGYAPYAPYNSSPTTSNLGSDPGYVNAKLQAGERIFLQGGGGLAAGEYTLLPARYALLPGAYLITPEGSAAVGKYTMPDGSVIMNGAVSGQSLLSRYEVASSAVVASRAQYDLYSANTFLAEGAKINNAAVPRLPMDAGHLVFQATQSISLLGNVNAHGEDGVGKGGLIDIASLSDILIGGPGTTAPNNTTLVLDATRLSSFGADSLLIGGIRTLASTGTTVTVKTNTLTVDNANAPLTGPEIILVANKALTLDAGAQVIQTGEMQGTADDLTLGNTTTTGSGNGLLLRVSSDPSAEITRLGINTAAVPAPLLTIGAGALISGNSIILDSTGGTSLDPTATLRGQALSLNSGQIILQLDPNATVPASPNVLILAGNALATLQGAQSLSLLSYGTLDIYGSGTYTAAGTLALHAAAIRGFNNGGGIAEFDAASITLDNKADPTGVGLNPATDTADPGTLRFNAGTFSLGAGQVNIDHYQSVEINTPAEVLITSSGGLHTPGDLTFTTNLITAAGGTKYSIIAVGDLAFNSTAAAAGAGSGLGATLTLQGASVAMNSTVSLRSGSLTLQATGGTAADGVTIGGVLDVSGTAQPFYDVTQYTNGGEITLGAATGNVDILATGLLNVSAQTGGGNAGEVSISVPQGTFNLDGQMLGQAGAGGTAGTFSLDVKNLTTFTDIAPKLLSGGFTESQSFRVRAGDVTVDNDVKAHTFSLSADVGSITVANLIDASGATGGTINLVAHGSVVLESGSTLTVEADDFNAAGKGGAISLEAGSETGGIVPVGGPRDAGTGNFAAGTAVVDIQTGATINLGVKSTYDSSGQANAVKVAAAQNFGDFTGTLHLRAPQTSSGTDLQINAIKGNILGSPSNIVVEGYKVYQTATIDNVEGTVMGDGNTFASDANAAAIKTALFGSGSPLLSTAVVTPGAEIINLNGDLTLNSNWDLSTYRFGTQKVAGVLTLRAKGNLIFNGALSDGFDPSLQAQGLLYLAPLMAYNPNLPINDQSWSYRLAAGADLTAADFHEVQALSALALNSGSLKLGKPFTPPAATSSYNTFTILSGANSPYQVIRTGSGDIDISVGRDVQLLNPFATIYTAGTILPHAATQIFNPGDFDLPKPGSKGLAGLSGSLGGAPSASVYTRPQYTLGGGNVTISAQGDIKHQTAAGLPESDLELPSDWLYRRSDLGSDGKFTTSSFGEIASTTWWVDFTNFFEGVGTFGGGNLTLQAGGNITNVDAVIATNARMVGKDANGHAVAPDASSMLELGGGDLLVKAGSNIDGGVYYVERGHGVLSAGNTITTNGTRAATGAVASGGAPSTASLTTLPTLLFLGKGTFDVSANGNILLGPTLNPFLLPQGLLNSPYYRTYFSTYSPDSSVTVTSLGGKIDLRESASTGGTSLPILEVWMNEITLYNSFLTSASGRQAWLRVGETSLDAFATALSLQPGTLRVTAFSGDINLDGTFTLSPAPNGTLDLFAGGAINGLNPLGTSSVFGTLWDAAQINVSDANPARIPSITAPLFQIPLNSSQTVTQSALFDTFTTLFAESGSTQGTQSSIETKLALHDSTLLHEDDSTPLHLYSLGGDIADFTLFSPKAARVFAANDLTDIGLYVQNVSPDDFTVVAAGDQIIAYNPNSSLLQNARQAGNSTIQAILNRNPAQSGDIQISGPGTLEVLAGAGLDLGSGRNTDLPSDLGVGITGIGNLRNPALPFAGADIIVAAGVGGPSDLSDSSTFDFKTSGDPAASNATSVNGQNVPLTPEEEAKLAIDSFFVTLRDSGRDHNLATSPTFGTYTAGFDAISQLFGKDTGRGDIDLSSRSIKTSTGGNINLLAPGGGVNLGFDIPTGNEVPPGIVTEDGGNISIFADQSVQVGSLRIFTLRGGNEIIWSSTGDIAAGNAAKTVKTAPPTRVVIDSQSADVQTDLAGLATGGGIGVLATVGGVPPGDVDLIAPTGTVDAGDAGIRATGNLTIAAVRVLNADNIQVSGSSSGVPTAPPATSVNLGAITAGNNSAAAGASAATDAAKQARSQGDQEDAASDFTIEVVSFTDEGN